MIVLFNDFLFPHPCSLLSPVGEGAVDGPLNQGSQSQQERCVLCLIKNMHLFYYHELLTEVCGAGIWSVPPQEGQPALG